MCDIFSGENQLVANRIASASTNHAGVSIAFHSGTAFTSFWTFGMPLAHTDGRWRAAARKDER
jgi:hypothetical protein